MIDTEKEEIPIGMEVDFKNLEIGSYYMNGNVHIKAQAESALIKDGKTNVK